MYALFCISAIITVNGDLGIHVHVLCLEYRVSWVHVPHEAAHFSLET